MIFLLIFFNNFHHLLNQGADFSCLTMLQSKAISTNGSMSTESLLNFQVSVISKAGGSNGTSVSQQSIFCNLKMRVLQYSQLLIG